MKRVLLLITLLTTIHLAYSQTEIEKSLKLQMWGSPPPEFKTTDVPDKWKNESAVVLALQREYIGDFRTGMNRYYVEKLNIHFRIKLLDKAAVEDYSDLSFNDKSIHSNIFGRASTYRVIGIKVIKPNKKEIEVDLSKAVKADDTSSKDLKIPIPNLEPGDIIDYFIAFKDESQSAPNMGDEVMLEGKYPIVSNTISFSIPHEFNFYSQAFNGAPEFKKETVKRDEIYTLVNTMQEKAPNLLWEYEYRTSPHVRYNLTSRTSKPDMNDDATSALKAFSINTSDVGYIEDFININFKKEKNQTKLIKEAYYLLRNPIYKKAYFDIEQGNPLSADYPPNLFFFLMDKYLARLKINHDIILGSPRRYGEIKDAVSFSSFDLMIRVNTNPPLYLKRPTPFSMPNELVYSLEGTEAACSNVSRSFKPLPASASNDNVTTTIFKTSLLPDDFGKLHVGRAITAEGHTKLSHQYLVFTDYDYLKEYNQSKYQVESSRVMSGIIKDYNKEKTKFEQRMAQDYNDRDKRIKDEIEHAMEAKISDYKLTVKSIGMWDEAPKTEYEDEFTLENMTKKAGPNIILEIGKLIEQQTDVPDDQKTRTRDVYMEYARTFVQNITFKIPEGYTVEGLDNLKKGVESDAGGFVSTADVVGSDVIIKTKKYYLRNYYSADEWSKITGFLKAASEFYSAKLLLKKV